MIPATVFQYRSLGLQGLAIKRTTYAGSLHLHRRFVP
jgi:hypothetical protein